MLFFNEFYASVSQFISQVFNVFYGFILIIYIGIITKGDIADIRDRKEARGGPTQGIPIRF